jgi:hypothetical protein
LAGGRGGMLGRRAGVGRREVCVLESVVQTSLCLFRDGCWVFFWVTIRTCMFCITLEFLFCSLHELAKTYQ